MDISEIKSLFSGLKVYEERVDEEDFFEVVFLTAEKDAWSNVLVRCLGEPIKPAGIKPIKEHLVITKQFGGIQPNQTLFAHDFQGKMIVAMFWPWSNEEYITLKLFNK